MSYFSKFSSYGKYGSSVSQWETSFFGGYEKILYDHPPVIVPVAIQTVFPVYSKKYVPYNTRQKLIDIFLLKVASYKTIKDWFVDGGKLEKVTINETNYLKVPRQIVKQSLNDVIENESELGSLFSYYDSFIIETEYLYEVKEETKKPKSGKDKSSSEKTDDKDNSDDEQGEGEGDDKSGEGKEDTPKKVYDKIVKQFKDALGEIKTGKTYNDYGDKSVTDSKLKGKTKFVQMKKDNNPCHYLSDEVKMANSLLNLLDINFDPKDDKINNLKMGKLDVSKIAEIPSGNTQVYYRVEENQSTKPFSVCILADESGSMDGKRIKKQNKLLKVLYKAFSQILPSDKIFVFGHSADYQTHCNPEVRIYNDKYFNGFEYTIDKQFKNSLNENYDGPVIEKVYERVRSQTSDNIIFISISDGYPSGRNYGGENAVKEMKMIIEKCKRDGFVTVGIGLDCGLVKEIYNYHVIVNEHTTSDKMMISNISTLINRVVKTEFQS